MRKIIYSFLLVAAVTLGACEGVTTEDTSVITYYVNFELQGEEIVILAVGTPYVEEGVIAMEGEQDITSSIITTGTVDSSSPGIYTITYSGVNKDGFASSVSRTVIIYDPEVTTDLSGSYTLDDGSYRLTIASGAQVAYAGYPVTISQLAPGLFSVSDFFGGYYQYYTNYGSAYAMRGNFRLNSDNTIDLLSSSITGWGDSLDNMEDGLYDQETGKINWAVGYAGSMIFYVTLSK